MSYTLHLVMDNLILQTVKGEYTIAEMSKAVREMAEMVDAAEQPCYVLVDLSKMRSIENSLSQVKNAVEPLLTHPDLKLLVAYGNSDSAVINFMASFMAKLFKIPVKTVRKQEEAIAYIVSEAPELDGKLQAALQKLNEQTVS